MKSEVCGLGCCSPCEVRSITVRGREGGNKRERERERESEREGERERGREVRG